MSSSKLGMFYSTTAKPQYQQLSKPKNTIIHPRIMKIMERPNNIAKPISKELKTLAMMNSKTMSMRKNAELEVAAAIINKDYILSDGHDTPPQNTKSFSMNFSQLTTGKPCASCGGR